MGMKKRSLLTPNSKEQKAPALHSLAWWSIKVVCGALLIANAFVVVLYGLETAFETPRLSAQLMVIGGGFCSIFHYLKLKAQNSDIQTPQSLETKAGLYRLIRHPMYLGDILIYSGLALLYPTFLSLPVLLIAVIALCKQANVEDQYLALRFSEQYPEWRMHSFRLIPYIY